jgi:outer membrane immunogenic protein
MKKLALFAALLTAATTSFADDSERQGIYGGLGIGIMNIDYKGADSLTNGALQLGYHFTNNWAAELQYTNSLSGSEVTVNNDYGYGYRSSFTIDVTLQTIAAYGVYRGDGDVYFKGKMGLLQEKVSGVIDTGLSVGAGVGFNLFDSAALELEATLIEQDITYFSASLNFGF